jgi:V8-like Glu-specific endopeptidase
MGIFIFSGGTILDETTILTAAHCKVSTRDQILYGTNKRAVINQRGGSGTKVGIKDVQDLGKELPNGMTENDWMIIKLAEPIRLGPTAKKVELGTYNEFIKHVLVSFN